MTTPRRGTTTLRQRAEYSLRFLERYGRTLTPEHIRLVQAYRGLTRAAQRTLLAVASQLVLDRVRGRR